MSLVVEERDFRVALFISLLTGVLVCFVYLLMNSAVDRQMILEAERTSQNWANYFSENIEDLEQIADGEMPSKESLRKMALARKIGNVFRYKIFSSKGLIRYVSDEPQLTGSKSPSLAKHNLKAARTVSTGQPFTQVKDGKSPDRPALYAETYLPLMKNGRIYAVVEVYVDQSKRYEAYKENFLLAILMPMAIIALAFGGPAAAFYIRTRQKEQADRTAMLEHRRLKTALGHMSQALCMFDADQKLEIANDQYGLLYKIPPKLLEPGTTLSEIIDYRIKNGIFAEGTPEKYSEKLLELVNQDTASFMTQQLNDGRTIAMTYEPKPGGGWVATHTDVTDIRAIEDQVEFLANYDAVTNLSNRKYFEDLVDTAFKSEKYAEFAVLCLDLDNFKAINDTLGIEVGNKVLSAVGERLKSVVGKKDTVARLGNDEFAIMQNSAHLAEDATHLADRICEAIGQPFDIDGHVVITDVSTGIAIAPMDGTTTDELIRNANIAQSRSRVDGRGKYRFFEAGMDMRMKERRQLEIDLRNAISGNELELYYQPLISAQSEEVCGFEALLRWHHPERGLVPPDEFIPVAEETDMIIPIGEWVIRQACNTLSKWPDHVKIAVNLSTVQFKSDHLVPTVMNALSSENLSPDRLELEITESIFLEDSERTLKTLMMLRGLGVRIAMDDFGTGYSSLGYLRSFPFDKIKLDRCFINDLDKNTGSKSIIRAVASLGESMEMTTTAEGVETEEQFDLVKQEGYAEVQGYYFSPPRPLAEINDKYFSQAGEEKLFEVA